MSQKANEAQPAVEGKTDEKEGGGLKSEFVRKKCRTTSPVDGVDIAMEESGAASESPLTVGAMMQDIVSRIPDHVALRYKSEDTWNDITYKQYYDQCISAAKSFLKVSIVFLLIFHIHLSLCCIHRNLLLASIVCLYIVV